MANLEEEFVRAFADPAKKARYLGLLGTKKGRNTFRDELPHRLALDSRYASTVENDAILVLKLLQERGAPDTCALISASEELDGRSVSLEEGVNLVVAEDHGGTILLCRAGELAYYEDDYASHGVLLCRKK